MGTSDLRLTCTALKHCRKDGHTEWVTSVSQTPDASIVVTGGMDNLVCMWRGGACHRLVGHNASVSAVLADATNTALSSSYDGVFASLLRRCSYCCSQFPSCVAVNVVSAVAVRFVKDSGCQ